MIHHEEKLWNYQKQLKRISKQKVRVNMKIEEGSVVQRNRIWEKEEGKEKGSTGE